jgi:hypothetical protein
VAQAPGGPDTDVDGGFAHGGWQAPVADQESGGVIFEQERSMDALLLGRLCDLAQFKIDIWTEQCPDLRENRSGHRGVSIALGRAFLSPAVPVATL